MYKFSKANGGWWYVCNTLPGLLEYYDRTQGRTGARFLRAVKGIPKAGEEGLRALAEHLAKKSGKTLAEAYAYVSSTVFSSQMVAVANGTTLFINEYGGYNFGFQESAIEATVYRPELVFPNYSAKDIRISRFADAESGRHYYAHVGELEVSSGTGSSKKIKWGTYAEAYENALRYCISTGN